MAGAGLQFGFNLITRGGKPGIYITETTSPWRWGAEVNVGWSIQKAWYSGPADQISIDTYLSSGIDISGSYVISADIFGSTDQNGKFLWFGVAAGEPGLGASYGNNNNTKLVVSWTF